MYIPVRKINIKHGSYNVKRKRATLTWKRPVALAGTRRGLFRAFPVFRKPLYYSMLHTLEDLKRCLPCPLKDPGRTKDTWTTFPPWP